ncbi:LuxR family transcriptional regulator [Methylobacterium sp. WL103]|uniref:helix-turn-helix transcriptional regulator n=1 Tax=Methylobacterium sp. WL103 TaxID=2603891 RepID=UPI0011CA2AC9|nr:LuxR family transcriptional regulator [Methylobacterium sp. WL103]TXN07014.1 LuxR family transcriptional regulator [Methylobacterium sp. WL103]
MLIGTPLLQAFGRMGCGGLILSTRGHVLAANAEARRILGETFDLTDESLDLLDGSGRDVIKRLLARARTRIQLDGENWMLTTRKSQRPLIMSTIPVPVLGEEEPHTVLILIDLDRTPQPHTTALERIFGLTTAEARLAALLASGATVAEAATTFKVSVATVRTQLAAIFSKTHISRQAELIILVSRLSALV